MASSVLVEAAVRAGLGSAEDFTLSGNRLRRADGASFFAKTSGNVAQLLGEAEGLKRMAKAAPGLAPNVYIAEETEAGSQALFVSDFIDLGSTSTEALQQLAKRMAGELHNPDKFQDVKQFGFPVTTHCGNTAQDNTWEDDWMVFFRDRRIGNLLNQIEQERGHSSADVIRMGREVQEKVIPKLLSDFDPPAKPVLVHGDLWSGNVATDSATGEPVLYDCSTYYGHGEADFGISRMFGPFNAAFYDTYHSIIPRSQPHYEERQKLYELYHHLNHFFLFGGSYASGASTIMQHLLNWADKVET